MTMTHHAALTFERDRLLTHIAVSCPADAATLSQRLGRPKPLVHDELKTLIGEGTVFIHGGALRATASATLRAEASPQVLREIFDLVIAEQHTSSDVRATPLVAIAEAGCTDETLLQLLVRATMQYPNDAVARGALTTIARARGVSEHELSIMLATEQFRQGDTGQTLALTDQLVVHADPDISGTAAKLAAMAHIVEHHTGRAEALYRHVANEQLSIDAVWAVVVAVGSGNLEFARACRRTLPEHSLTNHEAGLIDFADGVLHSVTGTGDGALDLLARSINTLAPLGADVDLPESPAALAALIAIGRGEPQVAEMMLERALHANLGGVNGTRRHRLLLGWALMAQGRMHAAETVLEQMEPVEQLGARDALVYRCLTAGLARRRTDLTAMREAWHEVRGHTFGMHLTLYDLLPLAEMMVIAARLHDRDRIQDLVQQATRLLDQLGGAVSWSAPLHWHGVLAAFQAEDPAALLPHAQALTAAGAGSPYAATLAAAGNTWLQVLRQHADFAEVEASVRALAHKGHAWDASRLAGQAALQHPEREESLGLMQLAREITRDQQRQARSAPKSSVLTSRELEVGRLVLDGQGYRAIGQQLFISPKTVEHHVARMRTRLEAGSRGELLEKLHTIVSALDQ